MKINRYFIPFPQHETVKKYHSILKQQLYLFKSMFMLHLFILLDMGDVKMEQSGHVVREDQVNSISWVMLPFQN